MKSCFYKIPSLSPLDSSVFTLGGSLFMPHVVHSGRSTFPAMSGRGDSSTRIPDQYPGPFSTRESTSLFHTHTHTITLALSHSHTHAHTHTHTHTHAHTHTYHSPLSQGRCARRAGHVTGTGTRARRSWTRTASTCATAATRHPPPPRRTLQ